MDLPYCTSCGTSVASTDAYCHQCGAPQAGTNPNPYTTSTSYVPPQPGQDFLAGMSERSASILCYIPVFGVIPAIIFLASQRFRRSPRVRFDGFQSVYLFVAWLIVSSAAPVILMGDMPGFGPQRAVLGLLKAVLFGTWVYLLIRAAQERQVRLPIIGDLAARSTAEQL
jgi:uncharacterized membrane protein